MSLEDILERYERLLFATGQTIEGNYITIQDPDLEIYRKMLIGDNFHRVYKDKSDYTLDDWMFRVKDPSKGLPLGVKEEDGYFLVLFDSNKKDLPTNVTQKPAPEQEHKVFPCNPGTKWEDIKITLIAEDTVRIKTPQGEGRFSYHKLNLDDERRGNKPNLLWITLKLFANYAGRLDSGIEDAIKRTLWNSFNIDYNKNLPNLTKRLNAHLKKLFNIKDSIFKYHYHKHKAYITKFEIGADINKILAVESASPKNTDVDTEGSVFNNEYEDIKDKLNFPEKIYFQD